MRKPLILIIDDDRAVCASLRMVLRRADFANEAVHQPKEVLAAIDRYQPAAILLDMNFSIDTSGRQGLKLLGELQRMVPYIPVILMTGWATVQLAVEGMKLGARDFIAKPWNNKELLRSLRNNLSEVPIQEHTEQGIDRIIGQDPALLELLDTARQIAPTNASVLIRGESGTGKELIAEAIHYESRRAGNSFVKVNLGGVPESLFESEMFGHVKGAFTDAHADRQGRFALAHEGTIFLDEIGELPLANQVKLLRVLQEQTFEVLGSSRQQKVDFRLISATNKNLESLVKQGSFREDLLYRINLITLNLPPLRERPGDIPLLATHFLENLGQVYERPSMKLTKAASTWLMQQPFPGNIRQLKNLLERTILLAKSELLDVFDFQKQQGTVVNTDTAFIGDMSLEELELKAVKRALSMNENNITAAAKSLGITRSALYRRMQKYGIKE
ncbi:MAG: sigma-54 dependent transcriptional regulator [Bacteroidota bacterium]